MEALFPARAASGGTRPAMCAVDRQALSRMEGIDAPPGSGREWKSRPPRLPSGRKTCSCIGTAEISGWQAGGPLFSDGGRKGWRAPGSRLACRHAVFGQGARRLPGNAPPLAVCAQRQGGRSLGGAIPGTCVARRRLHSAKDSSVQLQAHLPGRASLSSRLPGSFRLFIREASATPAVAAPRPSDGCHFKACEPHSRLPEAAYILRRNRFQPPCRLR